MAEVERRVCDGELEVKNYSAHMFESQAEVVKSVKGVSSAIQQRLYGLFKQCKAGDIGTTRPGWSDPVGRAKWDAWAGYKGVARTQAGMAYCVLVDSIAKTAVAELSRVAPDGDGGGGDETDHNESSAAVITNSSSGSSGGGSSSSSRSSGTATGSGSVEEHVEALLNSQTPVEPLTLRRFMAAAYHVAKKSGVQSSTQLKLYGLYKQCGLGDNTKAQPGIFDVVGRAKWDAWKARVGMDRTRCGLAYCMLAEDLCGYQYSPALGREAEQAFTGSIKRTHELSLATEDEEEAVVSADGGCVAVGTEKGGERKLSSAKNAAWGDYPFDPRVHIITKEPDSAEECAAISELRAKIQGTKVWAENPAACAKFCSDAMLMRFLVGKSFDMKKAFGLLTEALMWRVGRSVDDYEKKPGWDIDFSHECETGKIYVSGFDKWQRPLVVFNNGVQNTRDVDGQMNFLAWSLNLACRMMGSHDRGGAASVDKYVVFMHLGNFSLLTAPGIKASRETIKMLCNCFPERLGHCIAYEPPLAFKLFFDSVKFLIDERTVAKMKMIRGDVSDGSENDLYLKELIGENWKELTGACQPIAKEGCSPGYVHEKFWPQCMARVNVIQARENEPGVLHGDAQVPESRIARLSAEAVEANNAAHPPASPLLQVPCDPSIYVGHNPNANPNSTLHLSGERKTQERSAQTLTYQMDRSSAGVAAVQLCLHSGQFGHRGAIYA